MRGAARRQEGHGLAGQERCGRVGQRAGVVVVVDEHREGARLEPGARPSTGPRRARPGSARRHARAGAPDAARRANAAKSASSSRYGRASSAPARGASGRCLMPSATAVVNGRLRPVVPTEVHPVRRLIASLYAVALTLALPVAAFAASSADTGKPTGHDWTLDSIFVVALSIPADPRLPHADRHRPWQAHRAPRPLTPRSPSSASSSGSSRSRATARTRPSCAQAAEWIAELIGGGEITEAHGNPVVDGTDRGVQARRADDHRLRPLRRPGAGAARPLDEPAVRARGARRPPVRPRDVRRQGELLRAPAGGARPRGGRRARA